MCIRKYTYTHCVYIFFYHCIIRALKTDDLQSAYKVNASTVQCVPVILSVITLIR